MCVGINLPRKLTQIDAAFEEKARFIGGYRLSGHQTGKWSERAEAGNLPEWMAQTCSLRLNIVIPGLDPGTHA
ncbi:MAG: hypothetical protein ACRECW_11845 [Phyllobacterium sp.]